MDHRTSSGMLSYRELGEGRGDPVVLLHAFPLNGRMFEPQMEVVAETRRVVAPDYPGFGRSPRTPAQPDVRYYAEGILGLLDRLKLVVEPSGAITVAALREGLVRPAGPTVAVLSGGNIEWDGLRDLLGDD